MKKLSLALLLISPLAFAAQPTCKTQTLSDHPAKMCVTSAPFQHDYYTLWIGNDLIFTLPDDYAENVSLTHRIPEDAAIEFPLSKQHTPTVTISGGCTPISEQQESDGKKIGIEVGRSCSFTWGEVTVLKDLQIRF